MESGKDSRGVVGIMRLKHLPGKHDQDAHGRRHPVERMTLMQYLDGGWAEAENSHGMHKYVSADDLPPIAKGKTRIFHGVKAATDDVIASIAKRGVLPGRETGSGEGLGKVLGVNRPSPFGAINIVVDIPSERGRHVNQSWIEFDRASPSEIVGILYLKHPDPRQGIGDYRAILKRAIREGRALSPEIRKQFTDL